MSVGLLPPVVAELLMDISEFSASADKAEAKMGGLTSSGSAMFDKIGRATVLGMAGIAVASVGLATEFETQMTRLYTAAGAPKDAVKAAYGEVLHIASSVGMSGTAMAEALYHPVSAGLDLKTALEDVKYSAEEAQISGASLDDTTYTLSSVMKAFNMNASQAHDTMALLNSIVGQGDMRFQDFNESVKNWAPTSAQMGISIQSMGAALAYLTDRGNSAEEASTRLTMGLTMMAYPSQKAAGVLEGLGVATSDVQGASDAMTAALRKAGITQNQLAADLQQPDGIYVALTHLKTALSDAGVSGTEADSAISKIFGGGRSDKAILSLMQNLDGLKTKFSDIGAGASQFDQSWADTQQTLSYKLKQLGADAENLGIMFGSKLIPPIEDVIGWFARHKAAAEALAAVIGVVLVGSVMKWVGTLLGPVQSAMAGAVKGMVSMATTAETASAKQALVADTMARWSEGASKVIPIVGGITAGIGALGMYLEHLTAPAQEASSSVDQFTIALINSKNQSADVMSSLDSASTVAQHLGSVFTGVSDPMAQMILGFQRLKDITGLTYPQLTNVDQALANMVSSGNGDRAATIFNEVAGAVDKSGKAVTNATTLLPQYENALKSQEAQQASAAAAAKNGTDALNGNTTATGQAADAANGLTNSLNQVNDAFSQLAGNISSSGMLHEFQKDLLSVKDTLDQNGKAFNENSLDGLKNEEAFRAAALAISNYRDAQVKNGVTTDAANKTAADQAAQLIKVWEQLTGNKKAVDDYAKSLGLVPKNLETNLTIPNLADEQAQLDNILNTMADITGNTLRPFSVKTAKHAAGGLITGAGTTTSDSIPAMLSNDEYVIQASAVQQYGTDFLDALNAGTVPAAPTVGAGYGSASSNIGGYGAGSATPTINVYVELDGQPISGAVRTATLQYDQRNGSNGLALAGRGFV